MTRGFISNSRGISRLDLSSCPSLDFLQTSNLFCALNLTNWLSSTRCENDIKINNGCKTVGKYAMVINKVHRDGGNNDSNDMEYIFGF